MEGLGLGGGQSVGPERADLAWQIGRVQGYLADSSLRSVGRKNAEVINRSTLQQGAFNLPPVLRCEIAS